MEVTCTEAQVARGSRDDNSPQEPWHLRNMISKSRWKLLAMLALFLAVMVWYSISREDRYIELFYFPVPGKKEPCLQGEAEKMVSKLFGNYSREQPFFLQLKDYFWVKTPSLYELPYGTKGSEDLLLRVLAITSYSIPESIQSLKCRRCVVVGNGHRLRNSSLGETINKYDVVIRLNSAPVAGYEQDVGSKTTMRLFYPESAHFNPKVEDNPDTLLVLVAFKAMDFHWIESILSDKKRVRKGFWKQPPLIWDVNPKQIRILNPFYMEIAADKLLSLPIHQPHKIKQKPTTGLLAITLALHLCDLVHIAGFGYPDAHQKKQSIHYYEYITLKSMMEGTLLVGHVPLTATLAPPSLEKVKLPCELESSGRTTQALGLASLFLLPQLPLVSAELGWKTPPFTKLAEAVWGRREDREVMKTVRFGTQGRTGRTRGREEMKPGDGQDTHLGSKINGSREKEKTQCPLSRGTVKPSGSMPSGEKITMLSLGFLPPKFISGNPRKPLNVPFNFMQIYQIHYLPAS
ncbi:CMP-N-acetylneuraminate-beta-galactosamide-alpha-2,3-sialyltransferase 4 isoform X3 [Bos mutus]|uniref:CMP-N-acetylneuraminate-beta-galactosamide- alpha-2,3-sialyltransferase 4 isoform X3 n=1 Tax=Bos mutus TaxID=72004 RepID=UPI0038B50AC4